VFLVNIKYQSLKIKPVFFIMISYPVLPNDLSAYQEIRPKKVPLFITLFRAKCYHVNNPTFQKEINQLCFDDL